MSPDALSRALDVALTRYAGMVRAIGCRHGFVASDADDLLQEVRIRLWRALESGEKIAAVSSSYVYRTAMSAALDLVRGRRRRREEAITTGRPSGEARLGTSPGADVALDHEEAVARIASAVDGLSATRRPVVRMYLSGYNHLEIAGLLGWSAARTRNLLYRGLEDLRERLTVLGLGPPGGAQ
jgi:RNA polymerase sigma-70 factor (ECF subfamily)